MLVIFFTQYATKDEKKKSKSLLPNCQQSVEGIPKRNLLKVMTNEEKFKEALRLLDNLIDNENDSAKSTQLETLKKLLTYFDGYW